MKVNEDPAFKQANPWWDTTVKQGLSLMVPMAQTPAWNAMQPFGVPGVRHVVEVAERVRVRQRPVLAPAFDVVPALHVVDAAEVAPVGAGIDAAGVVELDAEGVAATLGEELEDVALGVVSPDGLAEEIRNQLALRARLEELRHSRRRIVEAADDAFVDHRRWRQRTAARK